MKIQSSAGLLIVALAIHANADVMVKRTATTEGMGMFGGTPKEMTRWLKADRDRNEVKSEGKPSMFERMSGAGRPVITRLDKKVIWTLDIPKKRYAERSLIVPTSKNEDDSDSSGESPAEKNEKPTTRISKAEFKVTALGKKKSIGAFACEAYELRALLEMEDLKTHEKSEMNMVTELWTTPETGAVAQLKKEEQAYTKAHLDAMGLTEDIRANLNLLGGSMFAMLAGSGEKELSKAVAGMPAELKIVKGYPISTRIEWYGKAPGGEETAAEAPEESAELPTDVAGALGSIMGDMAKKKLAAKKPAVTKDGRIIFAMTTVITGISTANIPADTFEIPTGFKKSN